jgi:hypothetical protein
MPRTIRARIVGYLKRIEGIRNLSAMACSRHPGGGAAYWLRQIPATLVRKTDPNISIRSNAVPTNNAKHTTAGLTDKIASTVNKTPPRAKVK